MSNTSDKLQTVHSLSKGERNILRWAKRKGMRDGERGIFLEGGKLILEAVGSQLPLEHIWFTGEWVRNNEKEYERISSNSQNSVLVSTKCMRSISEMDTPPGIVAAAPEPGYIHLNPGDPYSLIVAVTKVQDPGNLGAVIRICDFFGVDEIWLGAESADPFGSKALRGAMGATFRTTIIRTGSLVERILEFKNSATEIWAASSNAVNAKPAINSDGSRILLIGGESNGLPEKYIDLADHLVRIPGSGRMESLNLAVAAGILVYSAKMGRYIENQES